MKKTLTLLLALFLTLGTLAAAPTFSGTFSYGYRFNFDGSIQTGAFLGDGNGDEAAYLYLKTSTDYADIDFRLLGSSSDGNLEKLLRDDIGATATVKLSAMLSDLFAFEMPVTVNFLVGNQAFSAKDTWAYADPYSEDDEIAMDNNRIFAPFGLSVGYKDYITVNAYANVVDKVAGSKITGNDKMVLVEALVQPVEGVRVQAAYLYGKEVVLDGADANDPGDLQFAALVDVGTLADLDFNLDVSGFYKGYTKDFAGYSLAKTAVTGGYGNVSAFAEYVFSTTADGNFYEDGVKGHSLYTGVSYAFQTKVPFSLGGNLTFTELDTDPTFGGRVTASTTVGGMTFQGRLGITDFTDIKSGYFRLASLISF